MDVPIYKSPQPPVEARPKRAGLKLFLMIAIIGMLLFGGYRVFIGLDPSINSKLTALSDTENEYENRTDGYTLPIPSTWRIFEEILHPERREFTADDIKQQLAQCGPSCASFSVVKMGNYLSSPCESGDCGELPEALGASLTVYGLANPEGLTLDNFLKRAFLKVLGGENIHTIAFGVNEETGESLFEGRVEFIIDAEGNELRSYFFILRDGIYYFDQDMISTTPGDTEAIFLEMERAIGLFDFE